MTAWNCGFVRSTFSALAGEWGRRLGLHGRTSGRWLGVLAFHGVSLDSVLRGGHCCCNYIIQTFTLPTHKIPRKKDISCCPFML